MFKLSCLLITIATISGCSSASLSIQTTGENLEIEETKAEMVNVVVVPFSYYWGSENINQNPLKQFERDVMRNLQNNFKKKSIKFYTEEQAKTENISAHQFMKLSVDHYNPGMPVDVQTIAEVAKQVGSYGGTTATVRATVTTTVRTIYTTGVVDVIITDSTGKNVYADNFVAENILKNQWSTFVGDSRAVEDPFGMKKDPGTMSQLEPFLKKVSYELDYRLKKHFNNL